MHLLPFIRLHTTLCLTTAAVCLILAGCDQSADPAQNTSTTPVNNPIDDGVGLPQVLTHTRGVVRVTTTPQTNFPTPEGILNLADKRIDNENALAINGSINGLVPGDEYGLFIAQYGDLVNRSGQGLGGIFDPPANPEAETPTEPLGFIGVRRASANGNIAIYHTIEGLSIARGDAPVLGRAIVVTQGPVNLNDPLGNLQQIIGVGLIVLPRPDQTPVN
ncbi:MAG: superoxide dismutase family protein [Planctomycetota bacterium]